MKVERALIFAVVALVSLPASADAQRRGGYGGEGPGRHADGPPPERRSDQDDVYYGRRGGALRPLRDIENNLVPDMKRRGADYIGAEYDNGMGRYRLKFVRDGSVIWLDVDGRTGVVVARAGR